MVYAVIDTNAPNSVIVNINAQTPYGRNNWRIPTPDELAVLEANADVIGLGNDIYLATDHRNGVLRLVSTGSSIAEDAYAEARGDFIVFNGTKWGLKNEGAKSPLDDGLTYDYSDMRQFTCPAGWRLPKAIEYKNLNAAESNHFRGKRNGANIDAYYGGDYFSINGKKLYFPYLSYTYGRYWCESSNGRLTTYYFSYGEFQEDGDSNAYVRCVRE